MCETIDFIIASLLANKGVAIIFSGIQASGKTTFYNTYFSSTHVHINLDTQRTRARERALLLQCLEEGLSFVADNTNPTKLDRERYINPAKKAGYKIACFFFPPDITESAKRNKKRGSQAVPHVALVSTANKLEMPSFDEGFDELFCVRIEENAFVVERVSR